MEISENQGYSNLIMAILKVALKDLDKDKFREDVEEFLDSDLFELYQAGLDSF